MWPNEAKKCDFIKKYYILFGILLSITAIMADFILQFYDDDFSFTSLVDSLIGLSALLSVIYISVCFIVKDQEIKRLTENLKIFEEYIPKVKIEETEDKAKFHTKIFIIYGIMGNIIYDCLPLLTYEDCHKNRSKHMIKYGIPCGGIVHYVLPYKQDTFPLAEITIVNQMLISTVGTLIVMTVTMLVCGILIHVSANLKYLRSMISNLTYTPNNRIMQHVNSCVKYHTMICDFAGRINEAFSTMMLVHITWTSFIISVLGFEIIMDTNYSNSIRFSLHLGGWLGMLFLICFYGQILMDDSFAVSEALYEAEWYEKPPIVRKSLVLILLRSQRPLVLKAAGVNVMSLATFLGVLYNAYSYFTLLLKIKP
ncbi:odorant receptor 49b-like [Anoplophora glabripennis]|uniref:odorant receptor 49b-like n=1 Tax=Anoplophora glabripennis TaxID=217634 RepID=UPI0008752A31|nr:odorant receptor 49b-like [Anoplophora glabripennis]